MKRRKFIGTSAATLGGMTVFDDKLGHVFSNSFVAMITGPSETIDNIGWTFYFAY